MIGCACWLVLLTFLATSSAGIWKTVNRPFYKLTFYNTAYSWSEAKSLCGSRSSLVQLDVSSVKNDVLNTISSGSTFYWIGATDETNEGHWKWMDRSSALITCWNSGEPNGRRSENYLVIDKNGKCYDHGTNYHTGVICMESQ
uniref:C-type lectin domain family 17, member A-like n=1 Tax=Styela clava TaxID=7725 RepID=UPI00193A6698|nr:C-type lectin domain family 17, member A-like [Styela clava]